MGNTKVSDRGTSEVVLLNVWMDLDTLVAVQQRETARVLGLLVMSISKSVSPRKILENQPKITQYSLGGGSNCVDTGLGRGT